MCSLLSRSLTKPTCPIARLRCLKSRCTGRSFSARPAPVAQRTQRNKLVVKAADDKATGQEAGLKDTKDLKEDIIFKPFDEVTSLPRCSRVAFRVHFVCFSLLVTIFVLLVWHDSSGWPVSVLTASRSMISNVALTPRNITFPTSAGEE